MDGNVVTASHQIVYNLDIVQSLRGLGGEGGGGGGGEARTGND